jgi:hypothetical protein
MAFALHPTRTILVQIGQVRPFSDIGGRHILRFDGSPHTREQLRFRLKNAGCPIEEGGTDWLTTGDFSVQ